MKRIIQRYQEGGVVQAAPQPEMSVMPVQTNQNSQQPQETHWDNLKGTQRTTGPLAVGPVVATGIPQGGYAKQAIADYMAGKTLGGPLSYVAGESNVPDYHALADALGTSVIDRYRPATAAAAAAPRTPLRTSSSTTNRSTFADTSQRAPS